MSESFDLSGFQVANKVRVGVAAKKAAGSRNNDFELKYRDGSFVVSNALWAKLGLDEKAVSILANPATHQVALKVVSNEEGTIFRRTDKTGEKKFRKVKAPSIENTLADAGILTKTEKVKGVEGTNQYYNLQEIAADTYLIVQGTSAPQTLVQQSPATTVDSTSPTPETYVAQDNLAAGSGATTEGAPAYTPQVPETEDLMGGFTEAAPQTTSATTSSTEDEDFDEKF